MFSSKGISPERITVNRDFVLSRITEVDIYRRYLGIEVQFSELVPSPLREDKHPTAGFKDTGTFILFHDFSGDFSGDCFNVVQRLNSLSYKDAIIRVAEDFALIKHRGDVLTASAVNPDLRDQQLKRKPKTKQKKLIQVKRQPWTVADKAFWTDFGIKRVHLEHFNVASCKVVWVNGKWVNTYSPTNPAYVYDFGNGEYKIYYPFRKKYGSKFLSNGNNLQGLAQLDFSKDMVIVTKSLKDVIVLYTLGYTAVAPPSEAAIINPIWMEMLVREFKHVVLFFDNDKTGIQWANKNSEAYRVPYMHIEKGVEEKDISDYRKAHGYEASTELIVELLKHRVTYVSIENGQSGDQPNIEKRGHQDRSNHMG